MQEITSAYANKMLRNLEEDKAFWVNKEASSSTYVAAVNEEPVKLLPCVVIIVFRCHRWLKFPPRYYKNNAVKPIFPDLF